MTFFQGHVDYKAMIKMRENPSLETLVKCTSPINYSPINYFLFFHRFIMVEREKDRQRERKEKEVKKRNKLQPDY